LPVNSGRNCFIKSAPGRQDEEGVAVLADGWSSGTGHLAEEASGLCGIENFFDVIYKFLVKVLLTIFAILPILGGKIAFSLKPTLVLLLVTFSCLNSSNLCKLRQ
jgi:hypothetical protein